MPLALVQPNDRVLAQPKDRSTIDIRLDPSGKESAYPIVLRVHGNWYGDPRDVNLDLPRDQAQSTSSEGAIESVLAANRSGNLDWILATYESEMRDRLRGIYADPEQLKKSAERSRLMDHVQLVSRIDYGSYVGFVRSVRMHDGRTIMNLTPPMRLEAGRWVICSDLGSDSGWRFLQELVSIGRWPDDRDEESDGRMLERSRKLVRFMHPSGTTGISTGAILYYSGRRYVPAMHVDLEGGAQEGSGATHKVLRRLFGATKVGDVGQILRLVHPSERDGLAGFVGKSVASTQSTVRQIRECSVREEIYYGDFVFVWLEYKTEDGPVREDWLVLKREGEALFLTDLLRKDPVFTFLVGRSYSFPKIGPILWDE